MKPFVPVLALSLALLPAPLVHADEIEEREFRQSLVVPLSRAEKRQLEKLLQKQKSTTDRLLGAYVEDDKATPAQLKQYRLYQNNALAADDALDRFRAAARTRVPEQIRRTLPAGAQSVYVGRHPIGARRQPTLINLWTIGGKNSGPVTRTSKPSPFHLDVWQAAWGKGAAGWQRVATTMVSLGQVEPGSEVVRLEYLRPATKKGPVLILQSQGFNTMIYSVVTFPNGFGKNKPSFVQQFSPGYKMGYVFGVDKRGIMTMLPKAAGWLRTENDPVLVWNGRQYMVSPTATK